MCRTPTDSLKYRWITDLWDCFSFFSYISSCFLALMMQAYTIITLTTSPWGKLASLQRLVEAWHYMDDSESLTNTQWHEQNLHRFSVILCALVFFAQDNNVSIHILNEAQCFSQKNWIYVVLPVFSSHGYTATIIQF